MGLALVEDLVFTYLAVDKLIRDKMPDVFW